MATEIVLACEDFTPLEGKTIDAFFHEDGYWRFFVALRTAEKEELVFTTEERGIAKYFEVFPIKFAVESEQARTWVPLEKPFSIKSVARLWRNEWLEPVEDNGKFLGSGPHHVHHAGSGLAGPSAVASVKVLAGVQLTDTQVDQDDWERRGVHPYLGPLSILQCAREMSEHDLSHLWQLRRLCDRFVAASV